MYNDSMAVPGISPIIMVLYIAVIVLMLASQWVLFSKAGQPGWACIIPIFNVIVFLKIAGKPWYWLLLMFIPFVNIVLAILALNGFLKAYGKGGAGSVLLAMFFGIIYYPYLAFSKNAQYVGA